jgi:hypothetical protein
MEGVTGSRSTLAASGSLTPKGSNIIVVSNAHGVWRQGTVPTLKGSNAPGSSESALAQRQKRRGPQALKGLVTAL